MASFGNGQPRAGIYEDGTYLSSNPDWHDADGPWKATHILDLLGKHNISPGSICDIGCGTGRILDVLSKNLDKSVRLSGFDLAPEPISSAVARNNDRISFRVGKASKSRETFDLALMIDVFEHVPDYMGFLEEHRSMATYFIFHIPLEMNVTSIVRPQSLIRGRRDLGHLQYFSRETALATLFDCGYSYLDETITAGSVELPTKGLRRRAAKLPRRLLFSVSPRLAARLLGGCSIMVLAELR